MTPSPMRFRPGQEERLSVSFVNVGTAAAGAMTLRIALPVGLVFNRTNATSPAGSCSAAAAAIGQTVTCQYPNGIGATGTGAATMAIDVGQTASDPSRIVAAIGDATAPGPSLATCSATPDAIGCGERLIPVSAGMFCNGLERLPRVCGEPQLF